MSGTFKNLIWTFVFLLLVACNSSEKNATDGQMQENQFILSKEALPDYEEKIDHKGLIEGIGDRYGESLRSGEHVYNNICINCHGTPEQEGSIPSAFKFWEGEFKVGNDPFSIYQTLSRGYGSMPPQTQLTPIEKYDLINFISETYVKDSNPDQYFEVNDEYLANLPEGTSRGPEPTEYKPWAAMDYGNFLINTYEIVPVDAPERERSTGPVQPLPDEDFSDANFAYKGIGVRLDKGEGGVAAGRAWIIFDHDLMRLAGAWTGEGFIDWEGILFNGRHNISPRITGDLHFENPTLPGWANPETGTFRDPRFTARDGRKFGPLPRDWAHFEGVYTYEDKVIVSYTVGDAGVLETYGLETADDLNIFTRTFNISPSSKMMKMRVAPRGTAVAIIGEGAVLKEEDDFVTIEILPNSPAMFKLYMARDDLAQLEEHVATIEPQLSLEKFTKGGPARYPEVLTSSIVKDTKEGPFQVDVINPPFNNLWSNQLRLSGLDFFKDANKGVVCSSDGDVWLVEGFTSGGDQLSWQRIGSGLFQPLGIKVVDEEIFVTCRNQLVKLHDYNGDNETDFYESFNNDHQVTDHFHEFAMGLQTDEEGNFYYAKSARHAREALVPQHGTLLKVSPDGEKTEIIAKGFRAANGVCINPDGTFIVTDQEGHWNPMNRINWVEEGGFYGNMFGYNPPADSSNTGMEQPLAWVDREWDQSPSELLWVDSEKWGSLNGKLLNFSYGYGKVFMVPFETVDGQTQGGIVELPIPRFSTGIMRGRFNKGDGQLYVCGLSAWGSTQPQLGGLYRIRKTNAPILVPVGINAHKNGITLSFSENLDPKSVANIDNFTVKTWDLLRSRKYGSKHYNTQILSVAKASIGVEQNVLELTIPGIQATWGMEIQYSVQNDAGKQINGAIQNTIHKLEGSIN
jgi:glucose/arabinose dehydrogenase